MLTYACVFVCIGLSANNDYFHYQVIMLKQLKVPSPKAKDSSFTIINCKEKQQY